MSPSSLIPHFSFSGDLLRPRPCVRGSSLPGWFEVFGAPPCIRRGAKVERCAAWPASFLRFVLICKASPLAERGSSSRLERIKNTYQKKNIESASTMSSMGRTTRASKDEGGVSTNRTYRYSSPPPAASIDSSDKCCSPPPPPRRYTAKGAVGGGGEPAADFLLETNGSGSKPAHGDPSEMVRLPLKPSSGEPEWMRGFALSFPVDLPSPSSPGDLGEEIDADMPPIPSPIKLQMRRTPPIAPRIPGNFPGHNCFVPIRLDDEVGEGPSHASF